MADHSSHSNGTGNNNAAAAAAHIKLAALLRECATHVERNEFHPDMYQALGLLRAYAGDHAGNPNRNAVGSAVDDREISTKSSSGSFEDSAAHLMNSLGKKFTKGLGLATTPASHHVATPAHASATSQKNAHRAKQDLEGLAKKAHAGTRSKENDWCDEHFCLGCQCKSHQEKKMQQASSPSPTPMEPTVGNVSPIPSRGGETTSLPRQQESTPRVTISTTPARPSKPAFQRPVNPNSILIANGWIEQQRRSKMRIVWKHVLASLVEGRKPGEETTLWIQREVTNAISGKAELEALHQIPIKWLTSVEYLDYSTDYRFALKVYNVAEEFTFRCSDQESSQNWVLTLQSVREIAAKHAKGKDEPPKQEAAPPPPQKHRMTISELRAIAHGAGISTAGMERQELEKAVANIAGGAQSDADKKQEEARKHQEAAARRQGEMDEQRRRGEAAAALEEKRRKQQALEEAARLQEETERRKRAAAQEAERRLRLEEERRRRQAEEAQRRRKEQEEQLRRAEEERGRKLVEEERRRRQLEDERRRQAERRQAEEEALRRRQAEEEALRRRQAEEEALRRRQAEEEALRRRQAEEEALRRRQAEEEAQRRRVAEQQAAEQRRRQEEAQRQRWQQDQQRQQWQQQQQQWQQQQQQASHQQQARQQQHYGAGGAAQQPFRPASPPGRTPPPPPTGAGAPSSPVNEKYAKMAAQDDDDGQAVITAIKHNILIHWALQPPQMQMLRPIDMLITTIHNVFPPAFGVAGHEYFQKWKALHREALLGPGLRPDEEKLKKSVRKLRFFLHPDKLPRDLNDEQQFMCKMLWDVTSDAWEEFEKHKEELDWIRG